MPAMSRQELMARRKWERANEALAAAGLQWFEGGCVLVLCCFTVAAGRCVVVVTLCTLCVQGKATAGESRPRSHTNPPATAEAPQSRPHPLRPDCTAQGRAPCAVCFPGSQEGS